MSNTGGKLTRKTAALVMVCTLPIFVVLAMFGRAQEGETAWFCTGMVLLAVSARWELRGHLWFWTVIAMVLGMHIPLIMYVPWTTRNYPGLLLLPVGFLDFLVAYGCITVAERFFGST